MRDKVLLALVACIFMIGGVSASLGTPSKVNVDSGSEFFSGYDDKVIKLEWTADSFDSSQVCVPADEISDRISTGEVKDEVCIKIDSKTSKAEYNIRDGGRQDYHRVNPKTNQWDWCLSSFCTAYPDAPSLEEREQIYKDWVRNNCDDWDGDGSIAYALDKWITGYLDDEQHARAYCVDEGSVEAHVGEIESGFTEIMSTTFTVQDTSKTLSNTDIGEGKSATFGNDIKINFEGGLESGYNFPTPTDELVAFHETKLNGFRVVRKSRYNDYKDMKSNVESLTTMEQWMEGNTNEERIVDTSLNQIADSTDVYTESEFYSGEFSGSDKLSNGVLTLEGNQMGSYPVFEVVIKADSLRYFIPEATPEILDTQGTEVKEGSTSNIQVTVGNKDSATGEGDFSAVISSCTSGFTSSGISKDVNLQPGESTTVDLGVSYAEDSDQKENSGTCTVQVDNLRDSSETVTRDVSVTGIQSNSCEPGSYSYVTNSDETKTIYKCSSDGQSKSEVDVCGSEERVKTFSDGSMSCVQKSDSLTEKCGDNVDNDGDGKIDENCGDNQTGGSGDTKKIWIPTQGNTECISQVVSKGTQVDPSYSSKDKCQQAISGNIGCAISTPDVIPLTDAEEVDLICGKNKVYANVVLTLIVGLMLGGLGYRAGRKIDDKGENTFTVGFGAGMFVLGAVIGFAVISVDQAIGFVVVSMVLYLLYKVIMSATGAETIKDALLG